MATELTRCPPCGGLLAHREDSEFQWKSCFNCGRQFDEYPLPRVKNASGYADPDGRRGNGSVDRLTRNPRCRKGSRASVSLPPIGVPSDYELEFDWPITLPALPDDDEDDDGDDDDGESLALAA